MVKKLKKLQKNIRKSEKKAKKLLTNIVKGVKI